VQTSAAPRTLPRVKWTFPTGDRITSSPSYANGIVYVGSDDGQLYAIDAATGRQRWMHRTGGPVSSSPAVGGGRVYVVSDDGRLHALDAATGELQWKFATQGERRFEAKGLHGMQPRTQTFADPFDVYLSSPVLAEGLVIFGSGDGQVYAVDAATGAQRWAFKTGDVVHASPALAGGVVYIGSWDRNVYALDAATGRERWRYTTGNDTVIYNQIGIASSAAIADGLVFVGGRDGKFHVVDAKTGAAKWVHNNNGGWTIASPAVRNGVVYFPTSDGTRFKGLDASTGEVKIDLQNKAVSFSSPAIVGEVALYGTSDGYLNAVSLRDGSLLSRFQTDGSKENGARYTDSTGRMQTGTMYPDRTLDGMMIGMRTMMTLGSVLSSPVVAGGVVYFGSTDGYLYAVR
jgi:outer membrane protein assembly factor BamB